MLTIGPMMTLHVYSLRHAYMENSKANLIQSKSNSYIFDREIRTTVK